MSVNDVLFRGVVEVQISCAMKATAAILGAHLIWASWNVLSTRLMRMGSDPVVFAAYREILCALVLCLGVRIRHWWTATVAPQPTQREAVLMGCCGTALAAFQLSFLFGVSKVNANTAGLSILLVPVLVLVATAMLGWEPLPLVNAPCSTLRASYAKICGVACACAGCAVLVLQPSGPPSTGDDWATGCSFLLVSALGTVIFTLTEKTLLRRFGEVEVIAAAYAVASLCAATLCAISLLRDPPSAIARMRLGTGELWALLYTVLFVGVIAYTLFTFANVRLPATLVTLYGILQPVLTGLLAFAFLGESPTNASLVGGPLIMLGLVVSTLATVAVPAADLETKHSLSSPLLPVTYSRRAKSFPRRT